MLGIWEWGFPYHCDRVAVMMIPWVPEDISFLSILVVRGVACEQALLFGQAKRASRERAREGPKKGELATIPYKFSFPPRKPRDSAKRENCHRKRAADYKVTTACQVA